jgi:single-strand DNA-binding protein
MSKSVNRTTLLGHIGKDPDVRIVTNDNIVANLTLATNEVYRDKMGETHETTEWHNLVAFGRTAEIVRDYVQKGSRIYVEGKIRTRKWDDKETGQTRYRTEIVIGDLTLLSFNNSNGHSSGNGNGNGNGNGANHEPRPGSQPQPEYEYSQAGEAPDDIPF